MSEEPTGYGMVPNLPGALTPYEIAVYVVLTWRTNPRTGGVCWPSHSKIAEDANMSERSVRNALASLREKGLVSWEQRRDARGATSSLYTVHAVIKQAAPGAVTSKQAARDAVTPRQDVPEPPAPGADELEPLELDQVEPKSVSDVPSSTVAVVESTDKAEARILAEYLSDRLGDLGIPASKRVVTDTWVTEIRRMIQRDMRTPDSIRKAIDWAMADPFWSANIHSPAALRRGYDKMRLQASRGAHPSGRDSQQRAVADEAALTGRPVADVRAEHMASIQRTAEIALAARRRTR